MKNLFVLILFSLVVVLPALAQEELSVLRTKAEQGDKEAQYSLGVRYDKGEGVPKDSVEAVRWFLKAAEQGDAKAPYNLGVMYDKGEGVPKDSVEAVRWYRKGAEQGYAKAQFNLGAMYAAGDGVPKDLVQAHMWFNLSGAKGREEAKRNLKIIEKQMSAEQKAEAMKLARDRGAKANP